MTGITPNASTATPSKNSGARTTGRPRVERPTAASREMSPSAIVLHPLHARFTEQAGGPGQEEQQRQYVWEPVLDATVEARTDIDLGQLLGGSDDQAAGDRS